ncbi:MAG: hypothetical protein J5521_00810 [Lachnospiraceae bacterium]|nr:hypothetical protein [Lachnospiraceae bacterium]MBR4414966.1 hypothetical protein [Aeriscardovia sp.]
MNIEKVINNTIEGIEKENAGGGTEDELITLLHSDVLTDEIKDCIYIRFKEDIQARIDDYLTRCNDKNASKGMTYCYLETWQGCIDDIGRYYFRKNNYLKDKRKAGGAYAYRDELLLIGIDIYNHFCRLYRKQFFIYDCALFLGLNHDTIYELSTKYADILKKAHTMQESSMRTALASGRSNVTAMAILLNHDYDYTRTTQIIHTTDKIKTADTLPTLELDEKKKISSYQNYENM